MNFWTHISMNTLLSRIQFSVLYCVNSVIINYKVFVLLGPSRQLNAWLPNENGRGGYYYMSTCSQRRRFSCYAITL